MFLACILSMCCINEPVVAMREKETQNSPVVSQALYSEQVHILEESETWAKIQTAVDGYIGWVPKSAVTKNVAFIENQAKVVRLAAHLYHIKDTEYGPILTLPYGSLLEVIDSEDFRWLEIKTIDGKKGFIQKGDVTLKQSVALSMEEMLAKSHQFLGLPYTWGGRSSFGYDCSGFIQMLFREMHIYLPRESKDQYIDERFEHTSYEALKPGDLIFWGLSEDKIRHVGLYLGDDSFIHASARENKPYLRISKLQDLEWNGSGQGKAAYAYRAFKTLK